MSARSQGNARGVGFQPARFSSPAFGRLPALALFLAATKVAIMLRVMGLRHAERDGYFSCYFPCENTTRFDGLGGTADLFVQPMHG
jgi:hypothetical protein